MSRVHSPQAAHTHRAAGPDVLDLIERLERGERSNKLDVLIEVALFEPDDAAFDAVPNMAGTKVIYAFRDGSFATHWARDWSAEPLRSQALAVLRATTPTEADSVGMEAEGRNAPLQSPETPEGREERS